MAEADTACVAAMSVLDPAPAPGRKLVSVTQFARGDVRRQSNLRSDIEYCVTESTERLKDGYEFKRGAYFLMLVRRKESGTE
ncbi:MAG: hypothetical protein ACI805_001437 [Candidatus Azotimanducaceae bacterium]